MASTNKYVERVKECRSRVYPDIAVGVLVWAILSIVIWKGATTLLQLTFLLNLGVSILASILVAIAISWRLLLAYRKECMQLHLTTIDCDDSSLKIDMDFSKEEAFGKGVSKIVQHLQRSFSPTELRWDEIDRAEIQRDGIRLYPKGEVAVPIWISSNVEGFDTLEQRVVGQK